MARRCTTVPGYGVCCRAAQQGMLGQVFRFATARGERCGECTPITRRNGRPGFRFRFHRSAECGIGPGGCPALASMAGGGGGGGGMLALPPPGQTTGMLR